MRCDDSINEACELLGSFVLIEEVINSVFGAHLMLCYPQRLGLFRANRSVRHTLRGKENRSASQSCYFGPFSGSLRV
jgi:hypothetical protein